MVSKFIPLFVRQSGHSGCGEVISSVAMVKLLVRSLAELLANPLRLTPQIENGSDERVIVALAVEDAKTEARS